MYIAKARVQRLYDVAEDRSIKQQHEFELEKGEDAPMSMAAHAEVRFLVYVIAALGVVLKPLGRLARLSVVLTAPKISWRRASTRTAGSIVSQITSMS